VPDVRCSCPHVNAERDKAWKRILAAAKRYDVEVSESSWRELSQSGKAGSR
jgi:hypothetical protein